MPSIAQRPNLHRMKPRSPCHRVRLVPVLALLGGMATAIAGCDRNEGYPLLLPTAQMLAPPVLPDHAGPVTASPDAVDAAVQARADTLRDRADALRRPVIAPDLRARMTGQ